MRCTSLTVKPLLHQHQVSACCFEEESVALSKQPTSDPPKHLKWFGAQSLQLCGRGRQEGGEPWPRVPCCVCVCVPDWRFEGHGWDLKASKNSGQQFSTFSSTRKQSTCHRSPQADFIYRQSNAKKRRRKEHLYFFPSDTFCATLTV